MNFRLMHLSGGEGRSRLGILTSNLYNNAYFVLNLTYSSFSFRLGGGGAGVFPYFIYISMCHLIVYGFQGGQSSNRVSFWHCDTLIWYLNHGRC